MKPRYTSLKPALSLRFLVKCNIIPDTDAFKQLKDDVGLHFSPLVKFNKARLQKAKVDTIAKVEQFPLEDYIFLLKGDEINMIGRRWASFDFAGASLDDCEAMQECTEGVVYLDYLAFNVARASDNTTIEVSAWERAVNHYHQNYDADQEFLEVKGLMQHKNSHRTYKGKSNTSSTSINWPVHLLAFLEDYLSGLIRFKERLRLEGMVVEGEAFFMNIRGQLPSAKELRAYLKIACEVFCIQFSPRLFRIFIESEVKQRYMEVCANNSEAAKAKKQMEETSTHMLHSEEMAEKHYRLQTNSCAQTTGKMVKTLIGNRNKRKLPYPVHPPSKKARPASKDVVDEDLSSGDDFKPQKPKRMEAFKSRLDHVLMPKTQRRLLREDEQQKKLCIEQNIQYEQAVSNESPSERSHRRSRNNIRLIESKCITLSSGSLSQSE